MDWSNIIVAIIGGIITLVGYAVVDRREKNKQMDAFKEDIMETLAKHRKEYLDGIEEVKTSVSDFKSLYQKNQAVTEYKIDNLEKSNTRHLEQLKENQNKHNNLIERTFILEKQVSVLDNREKVSEHRLDDLERK